MNKLAFLLFTYIFIFIGLPFFMLASNSYAKDTMHIKFSTWHPPSSREVKNVFIPMLEKLKLKSKGRITYTMYAGGALGAGPDHYDIVKDGLSDMGYFTATWTPGRFPMSDILSMSVWVNGKDISTDIGNAMYKRILHKEYDDVKMIELNGCINSYIWTKDPINKMSDLEGKRIACPGGMRCDYLKATGASVTFIPGTDFYMAMQTGTVDGIVTCPPILLAFKLDEVVNHGIVAPLGCVTEGIIMNKSSWNRTPEDLKPLIVKVCSNPFRSTGGLTVEVYNKMMNSISESGVDLFHINNENRDDNKVWYSAFQEATRSWVIDLDKKGFSGKEIVHNYFDVINKYDINAPGIPKEWIEEWQN